MMRTPGSKIVSYLPLSWGTDAAYLFMRMPCKVLDVLGVLHHDCNTLKIGIRLHCTHQHLPAEPQMN